jgi:ribosome assembly protein 1
MLYPDLYEATVEPKNKLERDLFSSNAGPDASVSAYVSKMFAVSRKDLPENKRKRVTAEEMKNKVREARVKLASEDPPACGGGDSGSPVIAVQSSAENEPVTDGEVVLGFARLYSGTIRTGTDVYCVLPKYDASVGPSHPRNLKYVLVAPVQGLYVMMGRELEPVEYVRAGNIFAIKGLEGRVWRNATLCAPTESGIGEHPDKDQLKDCLLNLGGVNQIVSTYPQCH